MTSHTLPVTGPLIATEADALDIIGQTYGTSADLIVIPAERLSPDFFRLAGAILQKFSNYQLRVAIVGDISGHTSKSAALRDFVAESNRLGQVRFLASSVTLLAEIHSQRPNQRRG